MCEWRDDWGHQAALVLHPTHPTARNHVVAIDRCLYPLVAVLNATGYPTIASCCGHGHRPGLISLCDGRQLLIVPTLAEATALTAHYPDIHGVPPVIR